MKKMLWVAAIAVFGLVNNVNGQCCQDSVGMLDVETTQPMFVSTASYAEEPIMFEDYEISDVNYETPIAIEDENVFIESDVVFADADPVVFDTVEAVETEVLMDETVEYPVVDGAEDCDCWGYSPVVYYGEGVSFDDSEFVGSVDNAVIEGEVISDSEATFTSAPVAESADEEYVEETPSEDEGEIEEALEDESDEESEPSPFDSDDVADEDESDFDENDFDADEELDQDLDAETDE